MEKWLCSLLKIHLVAKNSKCCIVAIGEDISKIFFAIIIIFQSSSHMWELAKSMTSGYKVYSIINGLPQRQAWGEVCHVVSCWVFFCDDMMSFNIKLLFTVRISAFRFYCIKAVCCCKLNPRIKPDLHNIRAAWAALWLTRAFPIADNVAKTKFGLKILIPEFFPNHQEISVQQNEIDFCGPWQNYVDQFGSYSFLSCAGLH